MAPRLLVLDSDPPTGSRLAAALQGRGFRTELELLPESLLARVTEGQHDMVLLRRASAPPWCGLETLRRLRSVSAIPCILVAGAVDGTADRVAAFEAGADDYLHRQMATTEAVARIHAVLRRAWHGAQRPAAGPPGPAEGATLGASGWRLSVAARRLIDPDGVPHPLTGAEFELLRLLAGAVGQPVHRELISRQVFRRPWRAEDRAVDDLVKRLRRKADPEAIQTVRGVGYVMPVLHVPSPSVEK